MLTTLRNSAIMEGIRGYKTMAEKRCVRCNKILEGRRANWSVVKYCDRFCRIEYEKERYRSLNPKPILPTATTGAINELRVAIDLLGKKYEVFRSLSPACSCDLAILKNKKLLRIEVRTAYKLPSGRVTCPMYSFKADILAKVLDDKIIYEPSLDSLF